MLRRGSELYSGTKAEGSGIGIQDELNAGSDTQQTAHQARRHRRWWNCRVDDGGSAINRAQKGDLRD